MSNTEIKKSLLCVFALLILIVSRSYAQNNLANDLASIHISFCNDKPLPVSEKQPLYLASRMLVETENSNLDKFENELLLGANNMKEENRIVFAQLLFLSRSNDFEKIQNLLKFSSKNIVTESYRNYFEGYLATIVGSYNEGFQKMSKAINSLPYTDIRLLLGFLGRALEIGIEKEKLKPFLAAKENIPNSDPFKVNLLAFENFITSPSYNVEAMAAFTKEAYSKCSRDESVALGYAIVLYIDDKNVTEAEKKLLELRKKHVFYSPLVDLYLARIYFEKGNLEDHQRYLDLAKTSSAYFGIEDKKILSELEVRHTNADSMNWLSILLKYGTIILVSILIVIVSIKFRKKRKS